MKAYYLFKKDWESELRTRYALNALSMFILVTISVIMFSIGSEKISEYLTGGLLWVVIFFSAMSGLSRAFVSEEERGTTLTLHLIASPSTIFSGKLLFNLILVFLMNFAITFLFAILFESFIINNLLLFLIAFLLGNIGIAVSSTIIAAIISKASSKGTLYPVLSFPILLPLILILLELTKFAMDGNSVADSTTEILVLVSYDVIMLTASYLLFDFIWKE
ncbi:cytochrome c-type biogenesis protein CcmB [Melioribacter roseus P3M-2]|uniref:Cytochrome c-type biogenesis protein CcmB n=1 Tax=Melioribacter roseus (strain DSM 23840 / JCM 17771 / VKM B-2668 / P3M-2) TaxID=1191523 RepID=I6ZS22_MELRP|nr:heme exporter protein CcmB [Melioribacter roseus]AFN74859.1 cytochrome c-type biogenesis protein CcmB [Melioribacter roseus P3M-2]